ncbi:1,4-alpha-glucan branching protein GlgB [Aquibacillus koreensis]|uniref:1,4-alpha-glucan branching enzyme GlgB n=1 Tax=Aquibacillus koreensis TaxID=279446 RepID=A0A9X3WPX3_9BACI|nr:1,4-alpha-glucan branching protein GlgB [Aquibacillus koreensis]MCT2534176.1 1,4-alpha-glucan branching protein GlgB [Aquibacillus koreensis]MDC3422568.1 1,4-alpha-glucan branching protein GlgB [Aquibacillus koreensis]
MARIPIVDEDIFLFHQGTNYYSHQLLGSHLTEYNNQKGYRFTVWAPNATAVEVAGDFNNWTGHHYALERISKAGLWAGFFSDIDEGTRYKYRITPKYGEAFLKADPYALQAELRPLTASMTPSSDIYQWNDDAWITKKEKYNPYASPILIYEMHVGSWRTKEDGSYYTYRELAELVIPYVKELGYTHIELLPLAEHPFDLSWGYQITGYYAVTSRYGNPNDFKYFVDSCHQNDIGVIMDWVPGHFCKDAHGLRRFDGEALYEYADARKAEKKSWGTLTFDFGRPEVQSFLISNAMFWLDEFHIDGLRVDAVASMIFLNFDRQGEDPIKNGFGGEENLEAIAFIKKLNEVVFQYFPSTLMMAEDSSDLPGISKPTYLGGLGFNFKWDMGWMNDMLTYMEYDPVYRKWHHNLLTFSFMYTYSENFVLPLSHDEVVHGKKSLLNKMPGDQWQQFANLRLLLGYMMVHPGKKLVFMGGEFGQYIEWRDQHELDWLLFDYPLHSKLFEYVKDLHHFYRKQPSLYTLDHEPAGFEWIDPHNMDQSVIAFVRKSKDTSHDLLIICNFTPNVYYDYKVGVLRPGTYQEVFNSDTAAFGGSDQRNNSYHYTIPEEWHNQKQHIKVKVPPLAISVFQLVAQPLLKED